MAPLFIDIYVSTEVAVAIHLVFTVLYPVYSIYGALYFIDKVSMHQIISFLVPFYDVQPHWIS